MTRVGTCSTKSVTLFHVKHSDLKSTWVNPKTLPVEEAMALLGKPIDHEYSLAELLRRPSVTYADVCALRDHTSGPEAPLAEDPSIARQIEEQIEIAVKYQGYIDRQAGEIERNGTHENTRLPEGVRLRRSTWTVLRGSSKADPASVRRRSARRRVSPASRRRPFPCSWCTSSGPWAGATTLTGQAAAEYRPGVAALAPSRDAA